MRHQLDASGSQQYDVRYGHHWSDLSQRLSMMSAFTFSCVVISACVLPLEPAIIFGKQRCILIGKTALANDATDLNQKSQFLIF
jgi:hypothetical protein